MASFFAYEGDFSRRHFRCEDFQCCLTGAAIITGEHLVVGIANSGSTASAAVADSILATRIVWAKLTRRFLCNSQPSCKFQCWACRLGVYFSSPNPQWPSCNLCCHFLTSPQFVSIAPLRDFGANFGHFFAAPQSRDPLLDAACPWFDFGEPRFRENHLPSSPVSNPCKTPFHASSNHYAVPVAWFCPDWRAILGSFPHFFAKRIRAPLSLSHSQLSSDLFGVLGFARALLRPPTNSSTVWWCQFRRSTSDWCLWGDRCLVWWLVHGLSGEHFRIWVSHFRAPTPNTASTCRPRWVFRERKPFQRTLFQLSTHRFASLDAWRAR